MIEGNIKRVKKFRKRSTNEYGRAGVSLSLAESKKQKRRGSIEVEEGKPK